MSIKNKTKKTTHKKAKKTSRKTTKKKHHPKKTTERKQIKKTARKKADMRQRKSPVLVCAYGTECFWVKDGPILKDLIELRDALNEMDHETFKHHVNEDRNDFADWVHLVLSDRSCANELRKVAKPSTARRVLIRRLRYYHS